MRLAVHYTVLFKCCLHYTVLFKEQGARLSLNFDVCLCFLMIFVLMRLGIHCNNLGPPVIVLHTNLNSNICLCMCMNDKPYSFNTLQNPLKLGQCFSYTTVYTSSLFTHSILIQGTSRLKLLVPHDIQQATTYFV